MPADDVPSTEVVAEWVRTAVAKAIDTKGAWLAAPGVEREDREVHGVTELTENWGDTLPGNGESAREFSVNIGDGHSYRVLIDFAG